MAAARLSAQDTASSLRRLLAEELSSDRWSRMPFTLADGRPGNIGGHRLAPVMWVDRYDLVAATIRRTPHASEGDEAEALHMDLYAQGGVGARSAIAEWLAEIGRLVEQDRQLLAEGGDPYEPGARHTRCHPLLALAVAAWGWDRDEVARSSAIPAGMTMVNARYENGLYAETIEHEVAGSRVVLTRKLLRRRLIVDSLAVTPPGGSSPGAPRILFTEQEGVPLLSVSPVALPDSTLCALPGRTLDDVMTGGACEPFGSLRIVRAWTAGPVGEPITTFELERGETMLA